MRIEYAGSVHDEAEIAAVTSVLRDGPSAMRIGKHVREMERVVAASFGKQRGVMCNSGSSALYLGIELLGLSEGDEIVTSPLTFSTDIAPMVRSRLVPVFVDVTPDTFQIDVEQIERSLSPRTKAILAPNLTGNCPDWDAIRAIADRRGLLVIEDSCDCLGATQNGEPTGTRSDISVTSFALSHIITAVGRAAWCASTTKRSSTDVSCCGVGDGAARSSCSAVVKGAVTDSLATSTASSTPAAFTTKRRSPRWCPCCAADRRRCASGST